MNRKTTKKTVKTILSYFVIAVIGLVLLYPILWMFFAAFKTNDEIFGSTKLLATHYSFQNFIDGWRGSGTMTYAVYFWNTFRLVIPVTLLTLVSSTLVAYGFARFNFPFKKALFSLLIATLMLPNAVIIIPRYTLFAKFGWIDTYIPFYALAALACYPFFYLHAGAVFAGNPAGSGRVGIYRRMRHISHADADYPAPHEAVPVLCGIIPVHVDVQRLLQFPDFYQLREEIYRIPGASLIPGFRIRDQLGQNHGHLLRSRTAADPAVFHGTEILCRRHCHQRIKGLNPSK